MENVYSEDDAGVSPQRLAVRVRVRGGLIPTYGDSFFCCRISLRAFFARRSAFFDMKNVHFQDHVKGQEYIGLTSSPLTTWIAVNSFWIVDWKSRFESDYNRRHALHDPFCS